MTCPELIPAYLANRNLSVDIDFKRYMRHFKKSFSSPRPLSRARW